MQRRDHASVQRYLDTYRDGGLDAVRTLRYVAPTSSLDPHASTLEAHFRTHPPRTTADAQAAIERLIGDRRGLTQVRRFLKKLGLGYRKARGVPAKADPVAQRPKCVTDRGEVVVQRSSATSELGAKRMTPRWKHRHFRRGSGAQNSVMLSKTLRSAARSVSGSADAKLSRNCSSSATTRSASSADDLDLILVGRDVELRLPPLRLLELLAVSHVMDLLAGDVEEHAVAAERRAGDAVGPRGRFAE